MSLYENNNVRLLQVLEPKSLVLELSDRAFREQVQVIYSAAN